MIGTFDLLSACLPTHIVDHISKIPISFSSDFADKRIWKPASNGKFYVRSV